LPLVVTTTPEVLLVLVEALVNSLVVVPLIVPPSKAGVAVLIGIYVSAEAFAPIVPV